jgi:hypothetical protein
MQSTALPNKYTLTIYLTFSSYVMKLKPPAMNPEIRAFHPSSLSRTILNKHWIPLSKKVYRPINIPKRMFVLGK